MGKDGAEKTRRSPVSKLDDLGKLNLGLQDRTLYYHCMVHMRESNAPNHRECCSPIARDRFPVAAHASLTKTLERTSPGRLGRCKEHSAESVYSTAGGAPQSSILAQACSSPSHQHMGAMHGRALDIWRGSTLEGWAFLESFDGQKWRHRRTAFRCAIDLSVLMFPCTESSLSINSYRSVCGFCIAVVSQQFEILWSLFQC